ncbi:MAG: lysoplasmalogenase family protein [Caulobacter sp.]
MTTRDTAARWALIGSILGGVSYIAAWRMGLPAPLELAWKGSGVGLLAVHAALKARNRDGWLLTAVMTFGFLGDVLLGVQFIVGAVAFLIGHAVAIGLYLTNRRPALGRSQLALALLLVPATVFIAFMLPADRAAAPGVAFYTLGLSLMAATAWTSRFPRFTVGIGALMFLVSDLVIFAKMGPLPDTFLTGLAVWVPYYLGQLLICVGVVGAARGHVPAQPVRVSDKC